MAGNKKPRGMRAVPVVKRVINDEGLPEYRAFGTKRVGQRLGKNTRQSDFERTKTNRSHTTPVTSVPNLI